MECSQRSKKLVSPSADLCHGRPGAKRVRLIHGLGVVEAGQRAGQIGAGRDLDCCLVDCA